MPSKSAASRQGFYEEDLAYIHDVGFGGVVSGWFDGLLTHLRQANIHEGFVVDIGCGAGTWVERLVQEGYEASGVDISAAMVALAKRRVPSARFHLQSAWDMPIPKCRALTALNETLCYRSANGRAPNLDTWFRKVFRALEPGGLLIFDLAEVGLDRNRSQFFVDRADWSCLVDFAYDEKRDRLHRQITSFRRVGKHFRRSREEHIVQLFRRDDVAAKLRAAGFKVRTVRKFGDVAFRGKHTGFIARKPN